MKTLREMIDIVEGKDVASAEVLLKRYELLTQSIRNAIDQRDYNEKSKHIEQVRDALEKHYGIDPDKVNEGDDLGHLDAEVFDRIDKEKQRKADLKKNDPEAYAREMEKDRKNYGRGIMGALRRKYDYPLDEEITPEAIEKVESLYKDNK